VSDLSNIPKMQDEPSDGQEISSPWVMLITMLLLIAGLFLASVLMMDHLNKTKAETGERSSGFSELVAKVKAATVRVPPQQTVVEPEATPKPQPSPLESLKQMVSSAGSSDKVRWPRLKLTGFGKSTDDLESFAIINGEQVHPGQMVDKVRVVEVRAHDVIVEYMGEQKNLTMDVQD
jgi:S1-C subfamily serine protease